jgi:CBS domain-containing protein
MATEFATLVTYNPLSFSSDLPLSDVWTTFLKMGLDAVPVRDEARNVAGITRHRELCRAAVDRGNVDSVTLADCITPTPPRDSTVTAGEILGLLLAKDLPILPIVEDSALVGVVSRSDFLRELSYHEFASSENSVLESVHKIDDWQESDIELEEAIKVQEQQGHGMLALGRGDHLMGVVSARVLTRAWSCRHFERLMRDEPPIPESSSVLLLVRLAPTIPPGSSFADAATIMLEHNVDAIAVSNAAGRTLGYITALDLLKSLQHELK